MPRGRTSGCPGVCWVRGELGISNGDCGSLGDAKIHLILGLPTIFLNSWGHPSSHIWQVSVFTNVVHLHWWLVGTVDSLFNPAFHWVFECWNIFSQDYGLHLLMAQIPHQRKAIFYVDVIDVYQPTNIWLMYLTYILPPKLLKCPQVNQPHGVSGIRILPEN